MADEVKHLSSYTKIKGTEISYSREDVLGRGTFGAVYRGRFLEKEVAIKRIEKSSSDKEKSEFENLLLAQHANVVEIFKTVEDLDFRFIFSPFFLNFSALFLML